MKYVVRVGGRDFIGEGASYTFQGSVFVPVVSSIGDARRYNSKALAERASKRKGENMSDKIDILEVEE